MDITITLPDDLAEQVRQRPDKDDFVARAILMALTDGESQMSVEPPPSKWAQVIERLERHATSLGEYENSYQQDREEFRRDFRFRHDDPS
jgi:hypothetical protein